MVNMLHRLVPYFLLVIIIALFGKVNPAAIKDCGGWRPCLERDAVKKGVPRTWFSTWNSTVQAKLERLAAISRAQQSAKGKPDGVLVVMTGDSTIIQQFQVLSEFVYLRSDFIPVQGDRAEIQQKYEVTFGAPRGTTGSVTFVFYRVFENCMVSPSNTHVRQAFAVYFGCGLHLLHLFPVQHPAMLKVALHSWINYETLLRNRVKGFRKVNENVKLVYMTTHPIVESKYFGAWKETLEGYQARDPKYVEPCIEEFKKTLSGRSLTREELEYMCLDTVFGARSVEMLNRRGLSAVRGLNVSVVPAHQLLAGESWATGDGDGRHYMLLVPVELFWFFTMLEDGG